MKYTLLVEYKVVAVVTFKMRTMRKLRERREDRFWLEDRLPCHCKYSPSSGTLRAAEKKMKWVLNRSQRL